MAQQSVPFSSEQSTEASKKTMKPFLHTVLYAPPPVLLELVHAAADDVFTFSKLGEAFSADGPLYAGAPARWPLICLTLHIQAFSGSGRESEPGGFRTGAGCLPR
jgi:hypothetical protein